MGRGSTAICRHSDDSPSTASGGAGHLGRHRDGFVSQLLDRKGSGRLDLALPDERDTLVAKSAITQARQRLKEDALAYLFAVSATEWSARCANADRWRGLALYGMDGTTLRVADSPENRSAFGGQTTHRGESGYPQVRVVAMMALRSHVLSAFRFANYGTGESTLARDLWREMPENSLAIVDRNFLIARELIQLECSGNRHWLTRAKKRTRYAVVEKLGRNDSLVVLEVNVAGMPRTWLMRAINYQVKGYPPSTLLTSLTDAEAYPANELIALYHERWGSRSPSTRSRRICLIDRKPFAAAPSRAYARNCGGSPSPTTSCDSKWNASPKRSACHRRGSVSSPQSCFARICFDRCAVADRIRWEISRATSMISVGTSRGLSCQSVDESALTHDK